MPNCKHQHTTGCKQRYCLKWAWMFKTEMCPRVAENSNMTNHKNRIHWPFWTGNHHLSYCYHYRYISFYVKFHNVHTVVVSQPSIYIDGWLYAMSMTSVVCNVPVLSQNDSTYHHSVFTTWKWHPFATWTPSFIILVWGHHPLIGAKPYLPASRTLVKWRTATP